MSSVVLKALFSSQTRVKLLSTFLLHPEEEYYIRELTRLLHEQINSIRRELENLRRIGLVKARHRNRKKYYRVDPEFPLYQELRNIFSKEIQAESPVGLAADGPIYAGVPNPHTSPHVADRGILVSASIGPGRDFCHASHNNIILHMTRVC